MHKKKIYIVIGARPNFVKLAPLLDKMKEYPELLPVVIHTGQHYDFRMSESFFQDLNLPVPDFNLGVGSKTHGKQTAEIMEKFEDICIDSKPLAVVVIGDVNSTLACALVAAKLQICVIHIEAGCRNFDMTMPEEINRKLTDHISNYLFCATEKSVEYLKNEGINQNVFFTGDLQYDALKSNIKKADKFSSIFSKIGYRPGEYYLATIHRADNISKKKRLKNIVDAFCGIERVVFPCHPGTQKWLKKYNLWERLNRKVKVIDPVTYLEMLALERGAIKIITDSGGVQREAFWLKVPCITLMDHVLWPELFFEGWNVLIETNKDLILKAVYAPHKLKGQKQYFGDGNSAGVMAEIINGI